MSELTKEEKRVFNNFCEEILASPSLYLETCALYDLPDSSFEYSFLFQRVKISAAAGTKALVKTIKDIRYELKVLQTAEHARLNLGYGQPGGAYYAVPRGYAARPAPVAPQAAALEVDDDV